MILKLPFQAKRYMSAAEIKTNNEWCARLAQLALEGATVEDQTEKKIDPRRPTTESVNVIDSVLEPFAEPPEIKCPNCGNDEITKFSIVFYARHVNAIRGFNKKGEVGILEDGGDWDSVSAKIARVEARPLAGYWLACHLCNHEQPQPENARMEWW